MASRSPVQLSSGRVKNSGLYGSSFNSRTNRADWHIIRIRNEASTRKSRALVRLHCPQSPLGLWDAGESGRPRCVRGTLSRSSIVCLQTTHFAILLSLLRGRECVTEYIAPQ